MGHFAGLGKVRLSQDGGRQDRAPAQHTPSAGWAPAQLLVGQPHTFTGNFHMEPVNQVAPKRLTEM